MSKWPRVPLSQVAISVDYGVTASAATEPVGPKFLRITDIQFNAVNWHQVPWCECSVREAKEANLRSGDIVFARTGATTGKTFLIEDCPEDAVFASYLIRVRLGAKIDPHFVNQFFQSNDYWAQISKGARGVAQPGVNATTLKALSVPLPSLPEQRRIAAILDQADALRAKRRQALAQLDSLTQSIFIEMFGAAATDQLGWPKLNLAEAADVLTGYAFKSDEFVDMGSSAVRLCRGTNVMPGRVDWQDLACWPKAGIETLSSFVLEAGDIVLAMDRPWISEGFKIARITPSDCPTLLVQRVARVRARANAENDFVYGLLLQPAFAQHCRPTETTIPHISPREIRSFELRLPPLALQQTFATRIQAVEALKTTHRAALAELDALFASLQHRAFAGTL